MNKKQAVNKAISLSVFVVLQKKLYIRHMY